MWSLWKQTSHLTLVRTPCFDNICLLSRTCWSQLDRGISLSLSRTNRKWIRMRLTRYSRGSVTWNNEHKTLTMLYTVSGKIFTQPNCLLICNVPPLSVWAGYQVTILWHLNKFCDQLGNSSLLVDPRVDGLHLWLKMEDNKLFLFNSYGFRGHDLLYFVFRPIE